MYTIACYINRFSFVQLDVTKVKPVASLVFGLLDNFLYRE